jgi:hypothetical protein
MAQFGDLKMINHEIFYKWIQNLKEENYPIDSQVQI